MRAQYFVRIGEELVEVTQEVYEAYYSGRRRELTQRERDLRNGLLYYDSWDNDSGAGAGALASADPSPEEQVIRRMLIEKLEKCLNILSDSERELIHALFYENEPLASVARRTGIPRKTLEGRRDKLLRRLRIHIDAPERG